MQAVLYTHQLEPITVLQIQPWLWRRLMMGDPIQLQVIPDIPFGASFADPQLQQMNAWIVTIRGEPIRRGEHETLMLFTADEEQALLLQSSFLPGQRRELRDEKLEAYGKGFMRALDLLMP